jgi:hypothetical protein
MNKSDNQTLDISQLNSDQKKKLMAQMQAEMRAEKKKRAETRTAFKDLTAEFVNNNIDALVGHQNSTEDIINKLFDDYKPIESLKAQVYGESNQESHTSTLQDGSASITIGYNVSIKFDGTESAGIEKIKNYSKSLETDDPRSQKQAKMINTFLKLNPKTGQLNPNKIIELSKLAEEFNDVQFDEGLDIIFKAQIRSQNSMYVSGWKYLKGLDGRPKKLQFRFTV